MFSLKANNIYDTAKPLHFCSRMFGLTAFSVRLENHNQLMKASVSLWDICSVVLSTVCSLIFHAMFISIQQEIVASQEIWISEIFITGMVFVTFNYAIISVISIWWTVFLRKSFSELLNTVLEVDLSLQRIKHPLNFSEHKKKVLIFILMIKVLTAGIICAMISYMRSDLSLTYIICSFLIIFYGEINILIIFHFMFWIWALKLRYKQINLYLSAKYLNDNEDASQEVERLNTAAIIHDRLVDACGIINRCYGVPVSKILL